MQHQINENHFNNHNSTRPPRRRLRNESWKNRANQQINPRPMLKSPKKGQFINFRSYTDINPFEIVEVKTYKKVVTRGMKCRLKEEEENKPDTVVGGFVGHTTNGRNLKYEIKSNPDGATTTFSLRKDGLWRPVGQPCHAGGCVGRLQEEPVYYYDYNF